MNTPSSQDTLTGPLYFSTNAWYVFVEAALRLLQIVLRSFTVTFLLKNQSEIDFRTLNSTEKKFVIVKFVIVISHTLVIACHHLLSISFSFH